MVFYQPTSKFGNVKATLAVTCLKVNAVWPTSDNVSWLAFGIYRMIVLALMLSYLLTIVGQFQYIAMNNTDIRKIAACLCTASVGTQYIFRVFYNVWRTDALKRFLVMFYDNIYIPG